MSAKELRNFKNQLDLLSFSEQLSVMEYLVKLLKRRQEQSVSDGFVGTVADRNGLDEAIDEEKRGDVFYYDTFDDLMADVQNA